MLIFFVGLGGRLDLSIAALGIGFALRRLHAFHSPPGNELGKPERIEDLALQPAVPEI